MSNAITKWAAQRAVRQDEHPSSDPGVRVEAIDYIQERVILGDSARRIRSEIYGHVRMPLSIREPFYSCLIRVGQGRSTSYGV